MTASRRRTVWWFLVTLAAILVPAAVVYVRNEATLRPHLDRQVRFYHYRTGDKPILADLAAGRVKLGDPVEDVLAAHPPTRLVRHDEYVTASYSYGTGHQGEVVVLIAKHGKLVSGKLYAAANNDQFFHDPAAVTPAHHHSYLDEMNREGRLQAETREAVRMSVAGFGAVIYPIGPEVEDGVGGPVRK